MKKILVINTKYKNFGGEDASILDELKFLRVHYEVDYLEYDNGSKITLFDLIAFVTNSNKKSNNILINKLTTFNPDIVYVQNTWYKSNLGIFKILEKANIKTILKIHNFRFECTSSFNINHHLNEKNYCPKCGLVKDNLIFFNKYFRNSYIKSFFVNLFGKRYLYLLKNNNLKILVLNNLYKNRLNELGIDNNKIATFYNPIAIPNKSFYNSNSDYVVYAGALTTEKGIYQLLDTWDNIENNLKLYVIGTSSIEDYLKERYSSQNIEFLGFKSNNEVLDYIKNSRAVITATRLYEGQPRLLTEASIYSVPSIYPSSTGMNEYFPKNYKFKFEQFNYSNLEEIIKKLQNEKLLNTESKRVREHITELLDYSVLYKRFNDLVTQEDLK